MRVSIPRVPVLPCKTMFRPIPEAAFFRRAPFRLIASIPIISAVAIIVILLLSVELFTPLSRRDLIVLALFLVLSSAVSIAAVISFLHYASTKRTLEEVKGLARNILQSIPTGILTINRSGVITAVNPTAEAVLKRPAAHLLGNSYEFAFANGEIIRGILDGALRNHRHISQKDVPYEGINGRRQTIRVSTVELTGDDGQPAGVLLQAQDVTQWLGSNNVFASPRNSRPFIPCPRGSRTSYAIR